MRVNSILASGIAFLVYYVSRIKDEASTDFFLFVDWLHLLLFLGSCQSPAGNQSFEVTPFTIPLAFTLIFFEFE